MGRSGEHESMSGAIVMVGGGRDDIHGRRVGWHDEGRNEIGIDHGWGIVNRRILIIDRTVIEVIDRGLITVPVAATVGMLIVKAKTVAETKLYISLRGFRHCEERHHDEQGRDHQ